MKRKTRREKQEKEGEKIKRSRRSRKKRLEKQRKKAGRAGGKRPEKQEKEAKGAEKNPRVKMQRKVVESSRIEKAAVERKRQSRTIVAYVDVIEAIWTFRFIPSFPKLFHNSDV